MRSNNSYRHNDGRFKPGNNGGPGRPPLAKETNYLQTLQGTCTLKEWKAICRKAVEDAKAGDGRAREWLCKYLVGEPCPDHPTDPNDNPQKPEVDVSDIPSELILEAKLLNDKMLEAKKKAREERVALA